jgi:hypothetical protein
MVASVMGPDGEEQGIGAWWRTGRDLGPRDRRSFNYFFSPHIKIWYIMHVECPCVATILDFFLQYLNAIRIKVHMYDKNIHNTLYNSS